MTPTPSPGGDARADLLERLKAATRPDTVLDDALCDALIPYRQCRRVIGQGFFDGNAHERRQMAARHPTASLDAALTLVERTLPGWSYGIVQRRWKSRVAVDLFHVENNVCHGTFEAPTAPLAVLIALLSALPADGPGQEETGK